MDHPDIRAELAEVFARARADIDAAERRALALLDTRLGDAALDDEPEWGTMKDAAYLRQCTTETMKAHVVSRGLGVKIDGRWQVDLKRVRRWLAGEAFAPLNPLSTER